MRKGNSGENGRKEKTDENSGHHVIASSRPPERQPLERRTLAPINEIVLLIYVSASKDVQSPNYFRLTQINMDSIGCTSEPELNRISC